MLRLVTVQELMISQLQDRTYKLPSPADVLSDGLREREQPRARVTVISVDFGWPCRKIPISVAGGLSKLVPG